MSFRSISTNNNHNTTLVVTAPSGIADGDVLIAWAVNDTYNTAPGLPAGFTAFTPNLLTTNVDACTIVAGYKVASSEAGSYTLTSGASEIVGGVACFTGIDTSTVPYRIISQTDNSSAGTPYDVTTGTFTGGNTDTACDLIFLLGDDIYVAGATHTGPSGYTVRADVVSTDGNSQTFAIATQDAVASGATGAATMSATTIQTSFGRMAYHFALKNTGGAATLEQEGYRWYADDGSESGSTALAAQDTNIVSQVAINRRLRVLINATGDPATQAFKLQWKKNAGSWTDLSGSGDLTYGASSNISASAATSTTARLTAPAGKTSGADFQALRISDDTNPLPTIDLASGKYGEAEWCIAVAAGLTYGDVYSFQVLAGTTALDTYTVTPTLTIGSYPKAGTDGQKLSDTSTQNVIPSPSICRIVSVL